jgi:hypothetical protein
LHDFADDVADALRIVKGMAGDEVALEAAGKSAKAFQDQFSGVPKKLKKSYELCGDASDDRQHWRSRTMGHYRQCRHTDLDCPRPCR